MLSNPVAESQRINRIRLEFKEARTEKRLTLVQGINRIRLEFKVICMTTTGTAFNCINRIRLEFKAHLIAEGTGVCVVLIESDWNLKPTAHAA